MSLVLGIDPGSTTVGYALLEKRKDIYLVDYGVIHTTPKIDIASKLFEIGTDMANLIQKYQPELVVVEKLFFTKNLKTGIDVSQCRGVILYESMKAGLKIHEYTPLQVKKAITGNGKADKRQIQHAIKILLKLDAIPKPDDAADAIAMAYMGMLNLKRG